MGELLDKIEKPNDIKEMEKDELRPLAKEIRQFLVHKISHTGGHLASNLGVVELTMALHLCCNLPEDKIVWDVGHQSYTHKILTGRKDGFEHLRQFGGMSGFPKQSESDCDAFDTGHSSTSISVALGLAKARDLKKQDHKIFAVIGDGALSGGMAYEAMNNAARLKSNLVIVLNDNQMSISKNVGGMSSYLGKIRTNGNYTELKEEVENALSKLPHLGDKLTNRIRGIKDLIKRIFIPGMLFEDMGLTYIGPIDGHNIHQMVTAFQSASKMKEAVIVHVCTHKGKGYRPAEKNPSYFHGVSPFNIKDGSSRHNGETAKTYTDIFSDTILEAAKEREDIVAVSAAMPSGTGLTAMASKYPKRFFDVGIAEEHAVTFAAGMAAEPPAFRHRPIQHQRHPMLRVVQQSQHRRRARLHAQQLLQILRVPQDLLHIAGAVAHPHGKQILGVFVQLPGHVDGKDAGDRHQQLHRQHQHHGGKNIVEHGSFRSVFQALPLALFPCVKHRPASFPSFLRAVSPRTAVTAQGWPDTTPQNSRRSVPARLRGWRPCRWRRWSPADSPTPPRKRYYSAVR